MSPDREIAALELALARRDAAAIPGGYDRVLDDEFIEFGSSGRVWTRVETLRALESAVLTHAITIEEFHLAEIAAGIFLAFYVTVGVRPSDGATVRSRRSSLWLADGEGYRIRFHQGTPLPVPAVEGR